MNPPLLLCRETSAIKKHTVDSESMKATGTSLKKSASSGAGKKRPPKAPGGSKAAVAGDCEIVFRRPGSAAGRNPDPKALKGAGSTRGGFRAPLKAGASDTAGTVAMKGNAWSGGDDGADAALLRALKMAGIDRVGVDPPRPSTAQATRDALHDEGEDAEQKLEDCYLAELSVAWDDALSGARPPTATADQRFIMGLREEGPASQAPGEYDIWRAEDAEDDDEFVESEQVPLSLSLWP